jgi:hypothetical protein
MSLRGKERPKLCPEPSEGTHEIASLITFSRKGIMTQSPIPDILYICTARRMPETFYKDAYDVRKKIYTLPQLPQAHQFR